MTTPTLTCEPEFISQTAEPMTPKQREEWWRARAQEANAQGATFHRFSYDADSNSLILLHEGWKVRPDDQGELRFRKVAK